MVSAVTLSTNDSSVTLTRTRAEIEASLRQELMPRSEPIPNGDLAFDIPRDSMFFSQDYLEAEPIKAIGDTLIGKWPEFYGFEDLEIRYVWKKKGGTKGGMLTLGTCQKASGIAGYFGDCEYIITIAADNTRAYEFTRHQMVALVYHELCHIHLEEDEKTGDIIKGTRAHDVEMFFAEIRRYGLWKSNLEAADAEFAQLRLPVDGER